MHALFAKDALPAVNFSEAREMRHLKATCLDYLQFMGIILILEQQWV